MALSTLLPLVVLSILSISTSAMDCEGPPDDCSCVPPNKLELICNNLNEFPTELPHTVMELVISNSQFTKIPVLPQSYKNLTVLVVENSKVSDIEDYAFQNVPFLGVLKVESNNLGALRTNMFNGNSGLSTLNLRDNKIEAIAPDMFGKLPKLQKLTLSKNPLKLSSTTFYAINEELETFECINCGLEAPPKDAFQYMPLLKVLRLNQNKFSSLDNSHFESMKDLKTLELDACEIETISSSAFEGLSKLESLDLGYNKLRELPEDAFDDLENIKVLSLENNQLNTLDEDLLTSTVLETLKVSLQGNPWRCDCELYWMKDVHFDGKKNVTCASPEEFVGIDVHNATESMSCDSGSDSSTIAIAIAIPIIIICVALIGYYVYKIIQARRKRSDQRKSVRYSSVYADTTEPKSRRPTSEL